MGAITGLLGLGGGAAGSGFGGPSVQPADYTGMANLQDVYKQLGQVAAGQGPNPAQAQYFKNIQDLAKQQAGALSSVQGISPALATRMISQQQSGAMQNAAAQAAASQAAQQLGAMGQMGGIAGQQAGIAAQMQANVNNINAALAQQQMQGQQGMLGGIMQAGGSALGLFKAHGGEVEKYAAGGDVSGPQSIVGKYFLNPSMPNTPQLPTPSVLPAVSGFSQGLGGYKGQLKPSQPAQPIQQNVGQGPTMQNAAQVGAGIPYAAPMNYGLAKGGHVHDYRDGGHVKAKNPQEKAVND